MIGAIAGDMIGSIYEWHPIKTTEFELWQPRCHFTDDTVLTIATAEALHTDQDFGAAFYRWGRKYPNAGYGKAFRRWLQSANPQPYGSWGNGSAMRVSPVAWVATSASEVLELAKATALPTHDHPRGILGAQATALAIWLARQGADREEVRSRVTELSGYDLSRTVAEIRPEYRFQVSCDLSVPEAIICALEASSWEDAVRMAISLGGDADTQAAIAGSIAEGWWGVGSEVLGEVHNRLPARMHPVLDQFGADGGDKSPSTPRNDNAFEALSSLASRENWCWNMICTTCGHSQFRWGLEAIARGIHPADPRWPVSGHSGGRLGSRPWPRGIQDRLQRIVAEVKVPSLVIGSRFPDLLGHLGLALHYTSEAESRTPRITRALAPQFMAFVDTHSAGMRYLTRLTEDDALRMQTYDLEVLEQSWRART